MEYRKVLVDTSVIIDYLRKTKKEESIFWKVINNYDCVISVVTIFELYSGAKNKQHIEAVDKVISFLEILSFDTPQAKLASKIFKILKEKNKLIEFRDIFIASCAIGENIPLVTLNDKHFKRIEDLVLLTNRGIVK